jgi:myo-inositol-1(or 4)-monophosphatase
LPAAEAPAAKPDLDCLAAIVQEAGRLAMRTFGCAVRSWTKGGSSPVCEADIAVNDFLQARLLQVAPGCGWLSEESEHDPARLRAEMVWVVDPIDGTRAYMAGKPEWAISVALVEHGRPIMGALFAPAANQLFLAAAGRGASLNGVPIETSRKQELAGMRVAGPKTMLQKISGLDPNTHVAPRVPSLALRIARVAQGRYDAAFASASSHDWDLAAADLLVHEADGLVTTLAGERLIYNKIEPVHDAIIAAGRARHEALMTLMRGHAEFA